MSVDKLVDSTQLDSDLTSVANAIRAKSGGSSQLAFPAGFVSEIQAIPSGSSYDAVMWGNTNLTTFAGGHNPFKVLCNYTSNLYCTTTYSGQGNTEYTLDLSAASGKVILVAASGFNVGTGVGALKEIVSTDGTATLRIDSMAQTFRGQSHLKFISCHVIVNTTTADRTFQSCTALQYINFVEEAVTAPLSFSASPALTDNGLVLMANGLLTGAGKSVYLHATPKARCSTLMGTVSTKTKADETTYSFFTQDANGTVTLADFITNTKGWTLA